MTITQDTDKKCIFCHSWEKNVREILENNVHRFHVGYQCDDCDCLWNDETETRLEKVKA
jgi:transposase-like protein